MALPLLEELIYTMDVRGFVILRGVMSNDVVQRANAAFDACPSYFKERKNTLRNSHTSSVERFTGDLDKGRRDCGKILSLPQPHCNVFRNLLVHPPLVPLLNALLGEGYRMDHLPLAISQSPGAEGFPFHGGAVAPDGTWADEIAYEVRHNTIRCRLINVAFALTDTQPGNGGFVVVPGSHKANFPLPGGIANLSSSLQSQLTETPVLSAGDAIVFSEALSHGALAWCGESERRTLFYRYAPANTGYGRGYSESGFAPELLGELSEAQKAVLQPPYHPRLDRKVLQLDSTGNVEVVVAKPRSNEKKDFDEEVYGHRYF